MLLEEKGDLYLGKNEGTGIIMHKIPCNHGQNYGRVL